MGYFEIVRQARLIRLPPAVVARLQNIAKPRKERAMRELTQEQIKHVAGAGSSYGLISDPFKRHGHRHSNKHVAKHSNKHRPVKVY